MFFFIYVFWYSIETLKGTLWKIKIKMSVNNKFSFQITVQMFSSCIRISLYYHKDKTNIIEKVCILIVTNYFIRIHIISSSKCIQFYRLQTLFRYCPQVNAAGGFCLDYLILSLQFKSIFLCVWIIFVLSHTSCRKI